jgi:hypothetical protein
MKSSRLVFDADYWRDREAQIRAAADDLMHPDSKRIMLRLAKYFGRLARRAEAESGRQSPDAAERNIDGRPQRRSPVRTRLHRKNRKVPPIDPS